MTTLDPKHLVDVSAAVCAVGSLCGTLMHILPIVVSLFASVMAIIWYGLQIYWARKDRRTKGL